MNLLYWPRPLNILIAGIGLLILSARATVYAIPVHHDVQTIVAPGKTSYGTVVSTKYVKRVLRGKVIRRDEKIYVLVPKVIVRTDHHIIKVPAQTYPLENAADTVVNPRITIYVPVPTTVVVPTTVTTTEVVTVTTDTTITVTLPLDEGGRPQ